MMNTPRYVSFLNNNKLINVLGVLATIALFLAVFSQFDEFAYKDYLNSDTLYLPSIYRDLFTEHNQLKDWYLNPAPNFFPDMCFYFVLMFLASGNFVVSSFLFSIIQYFFILFLFKQLFRLLMPLVYVSYFRLVFLSFFLFLLEYLFFTKDFTYTFYILSNSYHTGAFLMALMSLIVLLKYLNTPRYSLVIVLFLLSLVAVLSDRLFVVTFSFPAVITLLCFYKKAGLKKSLLLVSVLCVAVYGGFKLFELMETWGITAFNYPHKMLAFDNIKACFAVLSEQIILYMTHFGFRSITFYLFFSGLLLRLVLFVKIRKSEKNSVLIIYLFFSVCFDVAVFIAPVLNGSYTGFETLRYNIYPVYLSVLNNAILIAWLMQQSHFKKYAKAGKQFSGVLIVVILITAIVKINPGGLKSYFNYYPENIQRLDDLAATYHLKYGVAQYWNAKKTTLFSRKNLKVYSVWPDLGQHEHVINKKWFSPDRVFNYVLLSDPADTIHFSQNFKPLQTIRVAEDFYVVRVPEFKYDILAGNRPVLIK